MFKIVCDFDGTISVTDVVDDLLDKFATPEWQVIERNWIEGRINARECLARQTALVRAQKHDLIRFFHSVMIDPAFSAFTEFCTAHHLSLSIVSDGFDLAIQQILTRHGLDPLVIVANHFEQRGNERWEVTFPYRADTCRAGGGVCKCMVANGGGKPVILIGDGRSDICLARRADLVLAKGYLTEYCEAHHIPHLPINGFADVILIVQQLLSYSWHATDTVVHYH